MEPRRGPSAGAIHTPPGRAALQLADTDVMALLAVPDGSKGLERHLEDRFTIVDSRTRRSR
jgi:hypothetical protein